MNTENKIRNFLMNGFQANENRTDSCEGIVILPEDIEEIHVEEVPEEPLACMEDAVTEETVLVAEDPRIDEIQEQLAEIEARLEAIQAHNRKAPDMTQYVTSKELLKRIKEVMNERNAELSNQYLLRAMEQIAVMREDYTRLCMAMSEQLDTMSAEEVFSSFQTYGVDMENILIDGGVYIGAFPYEKLNTLHQRITGVVPTGDREKDGTIAERETNGYKYGDRVLLKEKVKIYKFSEALAVTETVSTEEENEETTKEEEE